ncbi:unnamed protein product, partial [Cylicostephanus goldi]
MVLAGTPPPDRPPPPPPDDEPYDGFENMVSSGYSDQLLPSLPPTPAPRTGFPVIKRNIIYAKDRIAKFDPLSTVERQKNYKDSRRSDAYSTDTGKMSFPSKYTPLTESSTATVTSTTYDEYPIYNPVIDYNFKTGMSFQQGVFPIDT